MRRFLITGAAGFLGSHLAARLLDRGAEVTGLVRAGGAAAARERIERLRENPGAPAAARLELVEGDVRQPALGLGADARRLFAHTDQVIHCAARLDFGAEHRDELIETNLGAVDNLLPLVDGGRAVLNLMSTAYVCGVSDEIVPETAPSAAPPPFRNPYEESKYLAERRLLGALGASGSGFRVLRPSIVVGAHADGRTTSFNTIYLFLEILEKLHRRAAAAGSELALRVRCDAATGLNLVPVDWLAEATLAIVQSRSTEGGIFHLTNPAPTSLDALGGMLSEHFRHLTLTGADEAELARRPFDARERSLDRALGPYRAYLHRHPRFGDAATRRALDGAAPPCPPLDVGWLGRMIDFAGGVGWGRQRPAVPTAANTNGAEAYCARLFDSHLAGRIGKTLLARAPRIDVTFEVRLTDQPDFRRQVELRAGRVKRVGPSGPCPSFRYEMSSGVLRRIASARLDPREAFFSRQAEIHGDLEEGLKFVNLIVQFFRESPFEAADGLG